MSYGYWLRGHSLIDVSTSSHIKSIINDPVAFGTTHEAIKAAYNVSSEPLGFEGKARAEIIKSVILKSGFIRIRQHLRPSEYWAIEFRSFTESSKDIIRFVHKAISNKTMSEYDQLVLSGLQDNYGESITAHDFLLNH